MTEYQRRVLRKALAVLEVVVVCLAMGVFIGYFIQRKPIRKTTPISIGFRRLKSLWTTHVRSPASSRTGIFVPAIGCMPADLTTWVNIAAYL